MSEPEQQRKAQQAEQADPASEHLHVRLKIVARSMVKTGRFSRGFFTVACNVPTWNFISKFPGFLPAFFTCSVCPWKTTKRVKRRRRCETQTAMFTLTPRGFSSLLSAKWYLFWLKTTFSLLRCNSARLHQLLAVFSLFNHVSFENA